MNSVTFPAREHRSSVLVAGLSSAFGVALLEASAVLAAAIGRNSVSEHRSVGIMLAIVSVVFIVIAIYVGTIVTTNTFATIIAGRTRTIALMRLIGSSAASQRRAVAGEGLMVGIVGALVGAAIGEACVLIGVGSFVAVGVLPAIDYPYFSPAIVLPIIAVILTTWLASWLGSRRVLVVTPMQATGAAEEPSLDEGMRRRGRNAVAITLIALGVFLLVLGVLAGLVSPLGVLIGLVGGIVSFTGLVLAAHLIMPPVLRLTGRLFGASAPARLAAANAVRYPVRSSRTTIGVVIGVTLITMFAVATQTYRDMITAAQQSHPEEFQGVEEILNVTVTVFSVLIGFAGVIAAVGLVNNLSLSVMQRTRELGLLRALGFSSAQIRGMILAEGAALTAAAVLTGLVLGVFYGWAGAQALLGSMLGSPGIVVPGVPWALIVAAVLAAAALALVASVAPARRATRLSPVAALAVE
ncbi:FtsX-like permease family protein [Microbacterium sp. STN6]|uniref:ABC transporter permease n=1 Tax=Microbacterium sp. STN6 TaxID=2995588 RepID=UPI002260FDC9|nr:ABC transporter permease [Microbacterium sp. STN6]MCX7522316.1 FtsX-like permease family protein [Microbacterium sp. STN6]